MPDAPAPARLLSRITISSPRPSPRARSSRARCQAVDSPWTPAPMMTYRLCAGIMAPALPGQGMPGRRLDSRPAGSGEGGLLVAGRGRRQRREQLAALRPLLRGGEDLTGVGQE